MRSPSHDVTAAHEEGATEHDHLLGSSSVTVRLEREGKPWYRPRPLWLVPFAFTAALCRGMTLAPRTEAFTQLACEELRSLNRHHSALSHHPNFIPSFTHANLSRIHSPEFLGAEAIPFIVDPAHPVPNLPKGGTASENDNNLPTVGDSPVECLTDPAVQAGAAKLQTLMVATVGVLSALTTGWWGRFGDRHGRTKVLACAITGLLSTDIMFIIVSNPPEILKEKTHKLFIIAPIVEGLLGGWPTAQGATYAYLSDCTSHGSRAHIYSRFSGVLFVGIALGPEIAALILRATHRSMFVFYTSVVCGFINLLLLLLVFPESLSNDIRSRNIAAAREYQSKVQLGTEGATGWWRTIKGGIVGFIRPLTILGPRLKAQGRGQDWSMTAMAVTLFCHHLTLGLLQIRYLYAEHVFSWDAEELSYYITAMGSARALHLLLILPTVIRLFKPVSPARNAYIELSGGKAPPSTATLASDVKFDLLIAKVSIGIDMLSHVLVTLARDNSQVLFVIFTAMSGLGTGLVPTLQSVAMSILLFRGDGGSYDGKGGAEVGELSGAISVLQAIGSTILGPLVFGIVYSLTVAHFPKTIFVIAAALLAVGTISLLLLRRPQVDLPIQIRVDTQVEVSVENVRGRSRKSKDIRQ